MFVVKVVNTGLYLSSIDYGAFCGFSESASDAMKFTESEARKKCLMKGDNQWSYHELSACLEQS